MPQLGSQLGSIVRRYFFSFLVVAYFGLSTYAWAQFPYDNICPMDETGATGNYTITLGDGTTTDIEVMDNKQYQFCNQHWYGWNEGLILGFVAPTSGVQGDMTWMSKSQENAVDFFGLVFCVMVFVVLFFILGRETLDLVLRWFANVYSPSDQIQHIDFSCNEGIIAYVPQIIIPGIPFAFLCCDVDGIEDLIGWTDPGSSYDAHNLIFDIPWDGLTRSTAVEENAEEKTRASPEIEDHVKERALSIAKERPIYSSVYHYPPAWLAELSEQKEESS